MYDLSFGDFIGYVAYVYYPGWLVVGGFVEFDLKFFLTYYYTKTQVCKKGSRTMMGFRASRQQHALHGLAIGTVVDRRQTTGRIQFAAKGRGAERADEMRQVVELLFTALL